jgi:hypothetical protein
VPPVPLVPEVGLVPVPAPLKPVESTPMVELPVPVAVPVLMLVSVCVAVESVVVESVFVLLQAIKMDAAANATNTFFILKGFKLIKCVIFILALKYR